MKINFSSLSADISVALHPTVTALYHSVSACIVLSCINDSVIRVLKFKRFGRNSATGEVRSSDCTTTQGTLKWSGLLDLFQTGSCFHWSAVAVFCELSRPLLHKSFSALMLLVWCQEWYLTL